MSLSGAARTGSKNADNPPSDGGQDGERVRVDQEKCHPNVTPTDPALVEKGPRGPKMPMFTGCRRGDLNPHVLSDTRPST